jgi:hypothetical protein
MYTCTNGHPGESDGGTQYRTLEELRLLTPIPMDCPICHERRLVWTAEDVWEGALLEWGAAMLRRECELRAYYK